MEIGTGAELTRLQNHVLTNTHGTTRVSSCCTSQGVFKGRKKHKEKKPRGHSAVFVTRTRKLKKNTVSLGEFPGFSFLLLIYMHVRTHIKINHLCFNFIFITFFTTSSHKNMAIYSYIKITCFLISFLSFLSFFHLSFNSFLSHFLQKK